MSITRNSSLAGAENLESSLGVRVVLEGLLGEGCIKGNACRLI